MRWSHAAPPARFAMKAWNGVEARTSPSTEHRTQLQQEVKLAPHGAVLRDLVGGQPKNMYLV
jgi:hypothetical protein